MTRAETERRVIEAARALANSSPRSSEGVRYPEIDALREALAIIDALPAADGMPREIAAAPDLYEALVQCETVMMIVQPRSHTKEYLACLGQVRAALAKAMPHTVLGTPGEAQNTESCPNTTTTDDGGRG